MLNCTLFFKTNACCIGQCILYRGRAIAIIIGGHIYRDFQKLKAETGFTKATIDGRRIL